jgi:hypothetical protein
MDIEFYRNALFNGSTEESFDTALTLSLGWFWMLRPYGDMYEAVN